MFHGCIPHRVGIPDCFRNCVCRSSLLSMNLIFKFMKQKQLILLASILLFSGCGLQNGLKHAQSSLMGLDRKITLYDGTGKVIREWRTRAKVEDKGGSCYFIVEGKAVTISGTFVIEEQ